MKRFWLLIVVGCILSAESVRSQSVEVGELEYYFGQLMLRDGTIYLEERPCEGPAIVTDSDLERSPYQLVRKMQSLCNALDQAVETRLLQIRRANVGNTQVSSRREIDAVVESVVRAHVLMKLAAVVMRYDDLYGLHSLIINDTLRRFAYPKSLHEILQAYRVGFESQNMFELHSKLVERYERYRNNAVRMKVTIDRGADLMPIHNFGIAVANEGTASHDSKLFAESFSLQHCRPIVENQHLRFHLQRATALNMSLSLKDYFVVDPTDLAKVRFAQEAQADFEKSRVVQLMDDFTDPHLQLGGTTDEVARNEYAAISIPTGSYFVYTRGHKPTGPVQPNFVVAPAPDSGAMPLAMWALVAAGTGVVVTVETPGASPSATAQAEPQEKKGVLGKVPWLKRRKSPEP